MKLSREIPQRRLPFLAVALLAILTMAITVGCSDDADSPPPANSGQSPAATQRAAKPGDAGVASKPREIRGLAGVLDPLDDGLAIWKQRPANEDRTGITADTIKLGRLVTTSNPTLAAADSVTQGVLKSVFKRVNEAGGIHGRKLELVVKDDGFNPAVAVPAMKQLVEEDNIFAVFNTSGCPGCVDANTPYLAQKGVPSIAGLCAQEYLEPVTKAPCFPVQMGREPVGIFIIDAVKKAYPNAKKVVFIYDTANVDDKGFKWRAAQHGIEVLSSLSFERTQLDISSQVQQAVTAKPDVIAFFGLGNHQMSLYKTLRQSLGSKIPVVQFSPFIPSPINEEYSKFLDGEVNLAYQGSIAFLGLNSPKVTAWQKVAEEDGWRASMNVEGAALGAEVLIRALELAGPDLTRQGLVEAMEIGFDGSWRCNFCVAPMIFGPQDHWSVETFYMSRWNHSKQDFEPAMGNIEASLLSMETSKGLGFRGNYPGYECQAPSAQLPKGTCPWKER